jgi:ABC-2 type transport system permease protein
MRQIFALAAKDLKILFRVKPALFFTVAWPLLIAILFGAIFGGRGGGAVNKLPIVLVDEDRTEQSQAFVQQLQRRDSLDAVQATRADATDLVRRGKRMAAVIVPSGFGVARQRMFYGTPPSLELLVDPSHKAEAGMLEGVLYEQSAQAVQTMMTDPAASKKMVHDALSTIKGAPAGTVSDVPSLTRFLGELDRFVDSRAAATGGAGGGNSGSNSGSSNSGSSNSASAAKSSGTNGAQPEAGGWKPVEIKMHEVGRTNRDGPRSGYEVSFVQGLVWAIFGCVMGFSMSVVTERTQGTFMRLRMAPLTEMQVLGGKALGCFLMLLLMQTVLLTLGVSVFGVRIASPLLMALAIPCTGVAFVGIMMLVASLGRTEEGTRGAGFATLMPMSLFGGGMIPLFIMPPWMLTVSNFSPVKWAALAVEGAMWRGFSLADMALPCGILLAVGGAGFLLGIRNLKRIGFGA